MKDIDQLGVELKELTFRTEPHAEKVLMESEGSMGSVKMMTSQNS